ncbi:MAG: sirohydrochlorin cobaltochelatase [Cetobacterium sp.]|uniref:sirohydrochlorin cobaltochelatase n=1 Tax=Cetobacterium sp. TaxID=2071632 RepID=UPI003F3C9C02
MNFYKNMKKGAIVLVHFGTTHDDTKQKTIDVINSRVKKEFSKLDFFDAYTSRIINRILLKRGIKNLNTTEILEKLLEEGYKHVILQPSYIINGTEMEALKREAENYSDKFEEIRVGTALLSSIEDYFNVLKVLEEEIVDLKNDEGLVMVGHGTNHPALSAYPMLNYIVKDLKLPIYIGTIEGYPGLEKVIKELKRDKKNKVRLTPFMFLAGDHAKNDIGVDWKDTLEANGIKVTLNLKGLGEIEKIQNIFIEKIRNLENTKSEDILLKKKEYSKGRKAAH